MKAKHVYINTFYHIAYLIEEVEANNISVKSTKKSEAYTQYVHRQRPMKTGYYVLLHKLQKLYNLQTIAVYQLQH